MTLTKGFTLIELILVMAIMAILLSFATINLLRPQEQASLESVGNALISDLRAQQLKALAGETNGTTGTVFGVNFSPTKYTLFRGVSFDPADPGNLDVDTGTAISITTTFPNATVAFSPVTGEVAGFVPGANTITLTSGPGGQRTITLNELGVIISAN